jgi:hypothetical protein
MRPFSLPDSRRRAAATLRRARLVFGVVFWCATSATYAQDTWLEPEVVVGHVRLRDGGEPERERPAISAHVEVRLLLGDLGAESVRRAAFDAPLASSKTDAHGGFRMRLPEWTTRFERRYCVVATLPDGRASARLYDGRRRTPCIFDFSNEPNSASIRVAFAFTGGVRLAGASVTPVYILGGDGFDVAADVYCGAATTLDSEGAGAFSKWIKMFLVRSSDGVRFARRRSFSETNVVVEDRITDEWREIFRGSAAKPAPTPAEIVAEFDEKNATTSVVGRAVDAQGRPIVGAVATVLPADREACGFESSFAGWMRPKEPFATAAADGRFRVERLPAGFRRVVLAAPGFAPITTPARTVEPGATFDFGALVLKPGATVRVKNAMSIVLCDLGEIPTSPEGLIFDVAPGLRTLGHWNGGCVREFRPPFLVPEAGVVDVDFK